MQRKNRVRISWKSIAGEAMHYLVIAAYLLDPQPEDTGVPHDPKGKVKAALKYLDEARKKLDLAVGDRW